MPYTGPPLAEDWPVRELPLLSLSHLEVTQLSVDQHLPFFAPTRAQNHLWASGPEDGTLWVQS